VGLELQGDPPVTSAREQALFTRRRTDARFTSKGPVFHSDAGSQTGLNWSSLHLDDGGDAGIAPSIGTVGDALDNALMESTIGLYKTELIKRHPRTWGGAAEVERETADWVHWFNSARIHTSIGRVPPIEHEDDYRKKRSASTGDVA